MASHPLPNYVRKRAFSLGEQLKGQREHLIVLKERSLTLEDIHKVYEDCCAIEVTAFALSIELLPYEHVSPKVKQCRADLNDSIAKIGTVKAKAAKGIKYFSGFGGSVLLFGANRMVSRKRHEIEKGIVELDHGITLMKTINE